MWSFYLGYIGPSRNRHTFLWKTLGVICTATYEGLEFVYVGYQTMIHEQQFSSKYSYINGTGFCGNAFPKSLDETVEPFTFANYLPLELDYDAI